MFPSRNCVLLTRRISLDGAGHCQPLWCPKRSFGSQLFSRYICAYAAGGSLACFRLQMLTLAWMGVVDIDTLRFTLDSFAFATLLSCRQVTVTGNQKTEWRGLIASALLASGRFSAPCYNRPAITNLRLSSLDALVTAVGRGLCIARPTNERQFPCEVYRLAARLSRARSFWTGSSMRLIGAMVSDLHRGG